MHFLTDPGLRPVRITAAPRSRDKDALIYLIIGRDRADRLMRVRRLLRRLEVNSHPDGSVGLLTGDTRTAQVGAAADAQVFSTLERGLASKVTAVDALGSAQWEMVGARLSSMTASESTAVDARGVVDGSIVATALGLSLLKTIAALAEPSMDSLDKELP